jgi:hypothetical protein
VLNTNPGFESGIAGWEAVSGIPFATDIFDVKGGRYALRAHAAAAGTFGIATAAANSVPVVVGQQYRISGWVKTEVAATAIAIAMDWYSSVPAFLSFSTGDNTTTDANVWKFIQGVVTAPASAATGRIRVSNVFAGATRMWLDNLRITRVSSESGTTQVLQVEQTPVNAAYGVIGKVIPSGSRVVIADAMRVGWGESN